MDQCRKENGFSGTSPPKPKPRVYNPFDCSHGANHTWCAYDLDQSQAVIFVFRILTLLLDKVQNQQVSI